MYNKFCILLTASIDPGNTPKVARTDILQREEDYYNALKYYLRFNLPIIFCENSGYQSDKIHKLVEQTENIEMLKFKSSFSYLGKSHGEQEIFNHVYKHSKIIAGCNYIIKVTGRLIVENLEDIIWQCEKRESLVFVNLVRNLTCTDSRFFIFDKLFYTNYFNEILNKNLNEPGGIGFEVCLARAFHRAMADGLNCNMLPLYPEYTGFNALNNKPLNRGVYRRLKYKAYYFLKLYVLKQTI